MSGRANATKWLPGVNVLLGLWLVVVPTFVWEATGASFWNDLLVGGAIALLGAYGIYHARANQSVPAWSASLNVLLGLWVIAAPFVWGTATGLLFWNDVVVGGSVAVLAAYAAYEAGDRTPGSTPQSA